MSYDLSNYQLPSNWEQKYDYESKRFFFIDHANKITTWIDPRIELYKKDHQQQSTIADPLAGIRIPSIKNKASNLREKEAKELHKKYSEFSIAKITEMLEKNYNNVSLVESELSRERQSKIEKEDADKQKQKQIEEALKKSQEENDKRIKEEVEKQVREESENRLKEEANKRHNEEFQRRIKEGNLINQKTKLDNVNQTKEDKMKTEENINKDKNKESVTNVSNDQQREYDSAINSDQSKGNIYKLNKGPNRSICNGPNRNNHSGPNGKLISSTRDKLAKGSDPANRCGPQADLQVQIST